MARVSDASRPEGGRSAPSPLGRQGAEGGLSKLIRSAGDREGLPVPLLSSNSKPAFLNPMSGVIKSYMSGGDVRRSFETGGSTQARVGGIGVTGRWEGTANTGGDSSAYLALGALWITEGELFAEGALASLVVDMLRSTVWSAGLVVSKAVRLQPLTSRVGLFASGPVLLGAVAMLEAVCAGVSMSKAAVSGCLTSLVTGGLGAGFLVFRFGGGDEEDAASGDTGGLLLAFRAANLGECLRLGGIGVPDFGVSSGVHGGVILFSCSSGE